jgi:hypothetical protein
MLAVLWIFQSVHQTQVHWHYERNGKSLYYDYDKRETRTDIPYCKRRENEKGEFNSRTERASERANERTNGEEDDSHWIVSAWMGMSLTRTFDGRTIAPTDAYYIMGVFNKRTNNGPSPAIYRRGEYGDIASSSDQTLWIVSPAQTNATKTATILESRWWMDESLPYDGNEGPALPPNDERGQPPYECRHLRECACQ